jgi:hypothetical protein
VKGTSPQEGEVVFEDAPAMGEIKKERFIRSILDRRDPEPETPEDKQAHEMFLALRKNEASNHERFHTPELHAYPYKVDTMYKRIFADPSRRQQHLSHPSCNAPRQWSNAMHDVEGRQYRGYGALPHERRLFAQFLTHREPMMAALDQDVGQLNRFIVGLDPKKAPVTLQRARDRARSLQSTRDQFERTTRLPRKARSQ